MANTASMPITNSRPRTKGKLRARPQRVPTDPRMREDRLCVLPDCGQPLTPIAVENEDPFCSASCCKVWYEVRDPGRR